MQAVVLVGGQGSRLRPITYDVPKPMVPLRNRPFISYMVDFLRSGGVDRAVLSMGYLPDPIQEYFEKQKMDGFELDYVVEDRPLGTAGGLKNAQSALDGGPVVVTNGDVLTGMRLESLIEAHRESGALATIALTSVEDPTAYGLVEVDHNMKVHRFVEKPAYDEISTSLINAGIYVLEPEVLEMIPAGKEVSIEREIFPRLQQSGRLYAYVSSSYWKDIGTPRSYLTASQDVLSGAIAGGEDFDYRESHPSIEVGKSVKILPPFSIERDCVLENGCTVGGRTALGRGCRIGEEAVVEGSILFDGVRVEPGAIIRGSIVGPNVRIGHRAIVRGLAVLGAECVIGEGNVLDQGIRVNPRVNLPPRSLRF
ncbi:NDP-sugar synthase [Rubrobacter taiwanensis]|jgi:mannose-1-phosphate guanylyltransferase|uniref:NDP-sugar synthase n=1 Tax=Rubrobacter taiwanensis TaxID=185139 RepID=A0A4R1BQ69_9ACTN|nr:NDP-sugar synthase [Rubrobacter taiwanensis]TCJ19437.1 NDP-sugar synthase [Rubrobacter taiwanensis]